ncbi:uncharacterized protein TNCV_3474881 [Trichonephila clavipes]|nr:uncharacterized protein TNCV_3474881 [Trichonephila clavipes]
MNETPATNTKRAGRRSDPETSWRRSGTNEGRTRKESIAKRDHGGGGDMSEAAVAEWYGHRIVADFVTSSSPVPLKTRRVGQRCTLNLSRAEMSSRWCGVVVRRGGASSGVVHVT